MQRFNFIRRRSINLYKCLHNSRNPLHKHSSNMVQATFIGDKDRYTGITVDTKKETCCPETFALKLEDSLNKWKTEKNRCIWFRVNINDTSIVPILAQKGFNFHHAREDFVMMYKWLPEDSSPNLPPTAHTNLGVGAMVLNDREQILAISEKHYEYPHWKLPGGYVEPGEDIVNAAVREVKEETGVDTSFLSLITFSHSHKGMFNNSDIFILVLMRALTENITIPSNEINDCRWMDLEEYINHPHVHKLNGMLIHKALNYQKNKIKLNLPKKTVKWATYTRDMSFLDVKESDY